MAAASDSRGWFAVPAPIRELFKIFPLRIYASEPLPARTRDASGSGADNRPTLYVYAVDEKEALLGRPSFNPSCLKWQTYLRIASVQVDLVPSNNHASPSGALPFLLPPSTSSRLEIPLTGERIANYARRHTSHKLPDTTSSPRLEAYQALLSQNIRSAWLHALYLNPTNAPLLQALYLPSNPLLRLPIHQTLSAAATAEILKSTRRPLINPVHLYAEAEVAFRALSTLLADDDWFFATPDAEGQPSLFDAEVFAYTHLILDQGGLSWRDDTLSRCLAGYPNLVAHRDRLYQRCWET